MGDTNKIDLGQGASAKQVVAGRDNTVTLIEQQIIQFGARQQDARFSLPPPPRDFTGRATEIETLAQQLTRGERAAITGVSGMGGIGKSALAQVVAARVAAQFPDGRLWIELRGTDESPTKPADAMRQVILALEPTVDLRSADDLMLAQIYRGTLQARRVLIVLDNAHDNVQIRPLLQADAAFLVTARATLTEGGLRPLRLDVMPETDARTFLLGQEARLTSEQADRLAALCGYLPLALKIAASYLAARPTVKPASYLELLGERRLELLRERDDPELNVEAAFSISYKQLSPDLQTLWRLLGMFPAPFGGSAAQYVWGIEDAIQAEAVLAELHRASLVEYDAAQLRYRLHDLLREFANTRLTNDSPDGGERRTAEKRYAGYYKNMASAAGDLYLKGGEHVLVGLKLFEQELTHIRAGQKWAEENWETDADAAQLCIEYPDAAVYVMSLRLSAREQIRWLEIAVQAARTLGQKLSEGAALGSLGNAYSSLGEVRRAIGHYEQALVIDREISDRRGEANALGALGISYKNLGEVRRAIGYYEQQLVIVREIDDRRGEGVALGNLGIAYKDLGEVRRAIGHHEQALVIAREIGDRWGEGTTLGNLGIAYADLGEVRRAIEYYEQQLAIVREIGDRRGEGNALGSLGIAYSSLGEVRRTIEFYEQYLEIAREISDRRGEANALGSLGNAYSSLGEVRRAIEHYEQHLAIAREIGDRRGEGATLGNLGITYKNLGEVRRAIEHYEQHLAIAREIGDRRGEANALGNLGIAYKELGDIKRAKEMWKEALGIYVAIEDPNAERVRGWLEE